MTELSPIREIYARPAIVEAVIDFRCVNRSDLTVRDLSVLADASKFSEQGQTVQVTEEHDAAGMSQQRTEKVTGMMLRSNDDRHVLQVQIGGMSYSRLSPYDRWETFRDGAREQWERYVEVAKPEAITRVGVRYMNLFQIDEPEMSDLPAFLNVHPVAPWPVSMGAGGFSLQLRRTLNRGATLSIGESTIRHIETKKVAVLLDLDAFAGANFEVDSEMWNQLEWLHVEVERAFEASITDKVRELLR